MDLKLYLSKSSVKLLDECVGELDSWHFDAINDPILLQVLIETEKSFIGEYLTNENIEKDEFEIFVPSYLANRTNKLLIKEGEKFDGMTQEEAAKRFPNNHVPDSDMDDDDDDDEEDEDEFEDGLDESDESEESDNPSQDEEDDKQDDDAEKDPEGTSSDEPKEDESQKEPEATESTSPSEEKPEDKPKDNAPKGDGSQFITMKVKDGKLLDVKISDKDPSKPVAVEEKKKPTPMKPASTTKPQYRSEHVKDVVLYDSKMRAHWYPASQEFLNVVNAILEIAEELGITEIEPVHFAVALFRLDSISIKEFFRDLDCSYLKAKRFFTNTSLSKVGIIPADISSFLTCLQDKVDITKPCQILMRDKEVSMIWNISMKMNKRNTVIVGEAGVGKSALIEKVTYDIVTGKAPKRFKNFVVLSLDVNSLIAGTTYRGDAEKRIKGLIEFLEKHDNVILFIDEVHTILGAGSCYEGEMDLANALKPILARGETIVIGATTEEEYEKYFARDKALLRRFEKVVVEEPESKDVYPMIENKIKTLSDFHGVAISREMVEYIIMISHCFNFEKKNPDKTLDLIDRSMVAAAMNGRDHVEKDDVLSNYNIFFKLFEGMGERTRKETAYHEAGHYLIMKLSDKLISHRLIAVSILPAEKYLGVTCYEYRKDRIPLADRDYYIEAIAKNLGGRVAERIVTGTFTAGAGTDLKNATETAHYVVSKLGITCDDTTVRNNIYLNTEDSPMYSDNTIDSVNSEVEKFIAAGYKRAEEIINSHRDLLDAIVEELLVKHIMSEEQLDEVCRRFLPQEQEQV